MAILQRLNEAANSKAAGTPATSTKLSFVESQVKEFDSLSGAERSQLKQTAKLFESKKKSDSEIAARTMKAVSKTKTLIESVKQTLGEATVVSNLGALANNYIGVVDESCLAA